MGSGGVVVWCVVCRGGARERGGRGKGGAEEGGDRGGGGDGGVVWLYTASPCRDARKDGPMSIMRGTNAKQLKQLKTGVGVV